MKKPVHIVCAIIELRKLKEQAREVDLTALQIQPNRSTANYSCFRRYLSKTGIYISSAALGVVAGIEGGIASLFFATINEAQTDAFLVEKTPFMIGSALAAFIVVFRMQICHDRWWEGRTHIGKINKSLKSILVLISTRCPATGAEDAISMREAVHNAARLLFVTFAVELQA